ncbi:hypothetical protein VKT23_009154 [Stygiomarasmius scandens]|uniref:Uncharacterized protein n=1 Tax=Marasmiellus scandens TaxID=2682957 RepID=A0ABR1JFK8_9AGAR
MASSINNFSDIKARQKGEQLQHVPAAGSDTDTQVTDVHPITRETRVDVEGPGGSNAAKPGNTVNEIKERMAEGGEQK